MKKRPKVKGYHQDQQVLFDTVEAARRVEEILDEGEEGREAEHHHQSLPANDVFVEVEHEGDRHQLGETVGKTTDENVGDHPLDEEIGA